MSLGRRLLGALVVVTLVTLGGTITYVIIEDLSLLGAVYLTVITISTVGFAEPNGGFSTAGQVATVIIVILGVGTVFYTATTGLEYAIEDVIGGRVRKRRQQRRISRMTGHIIICGYGRIGRYVHEFLVEHHREVVIVEPDESVAESARDLGLTVVEGDATDDRVLLEAGVERADVLIASARDDPDNVAIVLSARALQQSLRIVARANEPQTERKLMLAGADRVVTPTVVGAARMASMAEQADLAKFVDIRFQDDLLELEIDECQLVPGSALIGATLATSGIRETSGALVVAIITAAGDQIVNPDADHLLARGQTIVAIGTSDHMEKLRKLTG